MTTMLSATSATTPRSCVIRMTAESKSARSRSSSSRIWAWIVTSSAVVGSSPGVALVRLLVRDDGLDDLVADRVHRVQRRHRVLEDHRDLVPAHVAEPRLALVEEVLALVDHLALEAGVLVTREAEDGQRS